MAMAPAISNLRLLLLLVLAATFAAASKWGGAEDLAARGEALLRVSADPDPAELRAYAEARALMRGAKAATLATFLAEDVSGTGEPGPAPRELAGQPYTMAHDIADINGTGLPAVMFAWNAVDFINLKHDKRASLTVAARRCPEMEVAPGLADDALCPRLTILGEMEPPADKALAEAAFVEAHPTMKGFVHLTTLLTIRPRAIHFFGRRDKHFVGWLDPSKYLSNSGEAVDL